MDSSWLGIFIGLLLPLSLIGYALAFVRWRRRLLSGGTLAGTAASYFGLCLIPVALIVLASLLHLAFGDMGEHDGILIFFGLGVQLAVAIAAALGFVFAGESLRRSPPQTTSTPKPVGLNAWLGFLRRHRLLSAFLLFVIGYTWGPDAWRWLSSPISVEHLGQESSPQALNTLTLSVLPYFSSSGQLQWYSKDIPYNSDPLCRSDNKTQHCVVSVLSPEPEVDLCTCLTPSGAKEPYVFARTPDNRMTWKRPGIHGQGASGIAGGYVVFKDGEVISAADGKTIVPAILHDRGDGKLRPKHYIGFAVAYRPQHGDIIYYHYPANEEEKEEGLYRLNPRSGEIVHVADVPSSHWIYELSPQSLKLSEDERYAFMASEWTTRGSSEVNFSIFDIEQGRLIYDQRFSLGLLGGSLHDPELWLGDDGLVAFAYLRFSEAFQANEKVVEIYRIRPRW